jgi:hypothetical protein
MLKWEETDLHAVITPAFSCAINRGIINENRNHLDLTTRIFGNDTLMLAVNRAPMETVLAAMTKAIFVMMEEPKVAIWQCPLAMEKLLELVIGPRQIMLGLIINSNKLTIAIPHKYLKEALDLLHSTWHLN